MAQEEEPSLARVVPHDLGFDDEDLAENSCPAQGRLPGQGRARVAIIGLIVAMVIEAISIAIGCLDLLHLHKMIAFGPWAGDNQQREDFYTLVSSVTFPLRIGTVVVFLLWLYRAYANVVSFGVKGLENSPGWAVGSFFFPVFNLGGPLVIVQELWRASDPRARDSWKNRSASALAGCWWACFISGILLFLIGAVIAVRRPNTVAGITFGTTLCIVAELLIISAGILVIFLIMAIMRRQTEKLNCLLSQWPFDDPPSMATTTMRQIVEGGAPVLVVGRDAEGGGWQFATTCAFDAADVMVVSLRSMFERDLTIAELADLEPGWQATRKRIGAAWERERSEE
jgi:hypothetical protein